MNVGVWAAALLGGVAVAMAIFWVGLRRRQVHPWFFAHLRAALERRGRRLESRPQPTHVLFCFVDHFEPLVGNASYEEGLRRIGAWLQEYPPLARRFQDADGHPPKHTYFFPAEEYHPAYLDRLARLCAERRGEVEVHLHHSADTPGNFLSVMTGFVSLLRDRHGFLGTRLGRPAFAFIHGNWALDNSLPNGRWCGLDNEITLLRELNCYADFTFPSAPSETQPRTINQIYYATDDPARPKSHDRGQRLSAGGKQAGDLLIIEGPLTLNWRRRKFGIWPRIEAADFSRTGIPLPERVALWMQQAVHVEGRPEWVFVKIHTHGADERVSKFIFKDGAFVELCSILETCYNDGQRYRLHYVSARECYNLARAAQAGLRGDPGAYRDFEIPPPPFAARWADRPLSPT
jgi:hypothetical protein